MSSAGALFVCLVLRATAGLCSGAPCLRGPVWMYHHFVNSSVISLYPCGESQVLLEKMWWDSVSSCALQRSEGGAGTRGPGGNRQSEARYELKTWPLCLMDLVVGAHCLSGMNNTCTGSQWLCSSEPWTDGQGATSCIFSGLVAKVHQLQPHERFVLVPSFLLCFHSLHPLLASPFFLFCFFFNGKNKRSPHFL